MTEARMKKVDLRKEFKHLYNPSAKGVVEVEVPEMHFLMADGEGDPNTSEAYTNAVEALYALSYALKFAVKKEEGIEYRVMPLEGLWRTDGQWGSSEEIQGDKDAWNWTAMMMQPRWATEKRFEQALVSVEKKKNLFGLNGVRLEPFHEGRAAQVMHIGPFSEEGPTVEKVDRFIEERSARMRGSHHEIYLNDFRKTAPEKLKTIIRHPF